MFSRNAYTPPPGWVEGDPEISWLEALGGGIKNMHVLNLDDPAAANARLSDIPGPVAPNMVGTDIDEKLIDILGDSGAKTLFGYFSNGHEYISHYVVVADWDDDHYTPLERDQIAFHELFHTLGYDDWGVAADVAQISGLDTEPMSFVSSVWHNWVFNQDCGTKGQQ